MLSGIKKKKKRNSGLKIKSLWKKSKESYSIHCSLFITALFHVFDGSFDSFDSFAKFVFGSCVGQTDAFVIAESTAHNQCHVCIVKDIHAEIGGVFNFGFAVFLCEGGIGGYIFAVQT